MHCDTPLDPHSPYEGFWWSHMGWLLDNKVRQQQQCGDGPHRNSQQLCAQIYLPGAVAEYML